MTKAVTAIYRTHAQADLVRKDLSEAGIPTHDVKIVPHGDWTAEDRADETRWNDDLHALHVPEADMRTYQNAVRNGDHVVSVELDDDEHIERVKEIMRHPERDPYDIGSLDTVYEGTEYTPRAGQTGYAADDRYAGTRDPMPADDDGRVRAYTRPTRYSYDPELMGDRDDGTLRRA